MTDEPETTEGESEGLSPEQMRDLLMTAPAMMDGPPIHEKWEGMDGYGKAAEALGRAFLELAEADPTLLEVPSRDDDPTGFDAATNAPLWAAFKARWPDGNDWLGGPTGFQFGWAHGAARYALGARPVGNPALVTVRTDEVADGETTP